MTETEHQYWTPTESFNDVSTDVLKLEDRGRIRRDERAVHDRQAPVQAALALSNQRRVAASVQPGTAKRPGSVCLGWDER